MKKKMLTAAKRYSILLLALCFCFQSCKDLYEDDTFMAFEELPIGMYLKEHDDQFGQWVAMLEHAGLYATLNLNTNYTLFAPSNEGVDRYLQAHGYGSVTDIPKEEAAYLVRYHLIHGVKVDLGQFQSGAINDRNETDDNLSIEVRDGGLEAFYLNGESRFLQFDIQATNGIIHAIEDVVIPLTATIADRLEERYGIFYEAIVATGYEEMLRTVVTEEVGPGGFPIEVRYRYTVFAVADAAYADAGIHSLAELAEQLQAGSGPYDDPANPLHTYVSYHIMDQWRSFAELGELPEGQQEKNLNTYATNQLISITDELGELIVNYDPEAGSEIRFVEFDIPSKNGVVHELDNWTPLFTPPQTTVIWELTDYPDLAANVTQYRNPSLGAQYNRTFQLGELESYHWFAQPEDKANVLTYRNNRSNDGIYYTQVLNHDHLRIELGESGWIEMESPVIVAGTYDVVLVWPSPRQANPVGICAFALDGQMLHDRHTISNTTDDEVKHVTLGRVTFDETTTHTLRVISLDGRLITLDYIRFDPIQ